MAKRRKLPQRRAKRKSTEGRLNPRLVAWCIAVVVLLVLLVLVQVWVDSRREAHLERIAETTLRFKKEEVRLEEIREKIAKASESQVTELLRQKTEALNQARKIAAELMTLITNFEKRYPKTVHDVLTSARKILDQSEPLLNTVIDFTRERRHGGEWNESKENDVTVRHELFSPLRLEYDLHESFSGWAIKLHGENWTAYNGNDSALVITVMSGTSCPRFKLDVNTELLSQPGFFKHVNISEQERARLNEDGRCELSIPLRDLTNSEGISVLDEEYLSSVIELAIVFESEDTADGVLVIESIRLTRIAPL